MRRCERCNSTMAAGRPRVRRGRQLWCQTCAKNVDAPSGRYRPGTDIAKASGLSRDQNECDHQGPHNLHGQCLACGYSEPTEGDEPCDNPWCVKHEPEHTKAEHIDPPHLDPGHPDYQSAEQVINDALANHPDAWLLNHQGEGPSHLSARTAHADDPLDQMQVGDDFKRALPHVHHMHHAHGLPLSHIMNLVRDHSGHVMPPVSDQYADLEHYANVIRGSQEIHRGLHADGLANHDHHPLDPLRTSEFHQPMDLDRERDLDQTRLSDAGLVRDYQRQNNWQRDLHPDRPEHLPNLREGEDPSDPSTMSNGSSCPHTYRGEEADHSREESDRTRAHYRETGDLVRPHPSALCDHCGAYKWLHAEYRPSEVGKPRPEVYEHRAEDFLHRERAPFTPLRQSLNSGASRCDDCGGVEKYPGEHGDIPALHGTTFPRLDPLAFMDERGLTNPPPSVIHPSEHPQWPHLDTERFTFHPSRNSGDHSGYVHPEGDNLVDDFKPLRHSLNARSASRLSKKEWEPPTVSGVALRAADTGRLLMIQRSNKDEKDPARGTWEFPGGHHEDGDKSSLHAGIREWEEEVGHPFPDDGAVTHTWRSGPYQGHVVTVPEESCVDFSEGRRTTNPDDPDNDDHEQSAWWDPEHARKNPALRQECKDSWKDLAPGLKQAEGARNEGMPIVSAFKPRPRPLQMPLHPFTPHPDDPTQCVGCNNPSLNRHHDDSVEGYQPQLPRPLATVNEDGENVPDLTRDEIRNRWHDPDLHHFEDNREFDNRKRMVKSDPNMCNACGSNQKFVKGLCKDCWQHQGGALLDSQPAYMWETDSDDTKDRLKQVIHPKLDQWGRGYTELTPENTPARRSLNSKTAVWSEARHPHPIIHVMGQRPPRPLMAGDKVMHPENGFTDTVVGHSAGLLMMERSGIMHRAPIEGDHSKSIIGESIEDHDEARRKLDEVGSPEERDFLNGNTQGPTKWSNKTANEEPAKLPGGYLNEESQTNDYWAHPGPKAPYDPVMAHHGVEPKQEGHGPWHITRHPETRAYQLVDNQNRLVHSYSDPGNPSYELHDHNSERRAVNDWVAANQDHGHIPKWHQPETSETGGQPGPEVAETGLNLRNHMGRGLVLPGTERARRKGEPLEDAQRVDTQHVQFHAPAPPFPHSTEDPKMAEYQRRARENPAEVIHPPKSVVHTSDSRNGTTYRTVQHGEPGYNAPGAFDSPSPSEEFHGPYRVIQHAETGKFHVVDNQNRITGYGGHSGMDDQAHAEHVRDVADGRQSSKEKAKGIADSIWNGMHEIFDPGGTDESRRTERHTESLNDLAHRYEGGTHHPLTPGRFGADDYEHDGDGEGQPYYEVSHPSGYKARDYGGNNIHIYHAATGETAHDLVGIHGGIEGSFSTRGQKPEGFGHEDLHRELHAWVTEHGHDAEHHDPRIRPWQRRRGYTASLTIDAFLTKSRFLLLDEVRAIGAQVIAEQMKDQRFKGVTMDEDDDGFYVRTHRARSKSYPTPEKIPQKDVDFIESTGAKGDGKHWDIYGDGTDVERYGPRKGEKYDEFVNRVGETNEKGEFVPRKPVRTCAMCGVREGTINMGGFNKGTPDGAKFKGTDKICDTCYHGWWPDTKANTPGLYGDQRSLTYIHHEPFKPLRQSLNAQGTTPRGEDPVEPTLWWRSPNGDTEVHVKPWMPDRDLRENYGAKPHRDVTLHHVDTGNPNSRPAIRRMDSDGALAPVDQFGNHHPNPPRHVLKHLMDAHRYVQNTANSYADLHGRAAEQNDIRSDLDRVPRDMEAERRAHEMFKRLIEKTRDDDDAE